VTNREVATEGDARRNSLDLEVMALMLCGATFVCFLISGVSLGLSRTHLGKAEVSVSLQTPPKAAMQWSILDPSGYYV
jgi:hypothetical protein